MVLGIEPEPPVGTWIESTEAVEFWLRRLPKAHAAACRLIYIHGKSQDEAATEVGCSKSYLSRLHREAINWLIREYHQAGAAQDDHSSRRDRIERSGRPIGRGQMGVCMSIEILADRSDDEALLLVAELGVDRQGEGLSGGRFGDRENRPACGPAGAKQGCRCSGIG